MSGRSTRLPVLEIHVVRVILLTVLLVTLLIALTSILWNGFTITTVDGTTLSTPEKTKLLSKYNSYSGSIASVVAMLFHMLVNLLLPVFFLCFATSWVLSENKTLIGQWAPKLMAVGAVWLLSQGFNSVNVQFESPSYTFVIIAGDLVAAGANATTAFAMSTIASTMNVNGDASTDTILRSSITPQALNPQTACQSGQDLSPEIPTASIIFGYASSSWIGNLIPESVAREISVAFTMTDTITEVDESSLPGGDVNQSAVLFTYGFYMMWQQFASPQFIFTSLSLYDGIKTDDGVQLLKNIQNTVTNATDQMTSNEYANTSMWANISHSEISMEFSSVQLSPQIKFDAITFELPLNMKTMAEYYFDTAASSDFSITLSTSNNCSERAFWRRLMLKARSRTSVAHHISADEYTYDFEAMNLTIKNPRKTFSVTAGRLSWKSTDLAEVYGSKCDPGINCDGLYFPLANDSQPVVLGEAYVPVPNDFTSSQDPVTTSTLYYMMASGSDNWTNLTEYSCGYKWFTYVTQIAQNHLYSTDSYQPAYTAGLFWLFQNAAVKDVVQTTSASTGVGLSFNGNRISLSSRASMPELSDYLTYAGCALLLILGVMIAFSVCNSSHQKALTENFSVQNVAAMLLDTTQYPPLLVQGAVGDVKIIDMSLQETIENKGHPMDSSDIEFYTLSER